MIRLFNVSHSLREEGIDPVPIMRNVSVELPANRRLVILGEDHKELSEVLLMLAGMRRPDRGWITFGDLRCSPVVNAGSAAGRTLVSQLSAVDNIRLAARTHGLDEAMLIAVVEAGCQFGKMLWAPVGSLDRTAKRKLEATLIAAIPFDCYYIDRLHEFEGPIVWQFVHVAAQRGAGILFTSRMANQTRKFAQMAATVKDGSLGMRQNVTEALADHAR
jgi:ABC-type polysaccharide/polyol phosphate transport system ATPase subunit